MAYARMLVGPEHQTGGTTRMTGCCWEELAYRCFGIFCPLPEEPGPGALMESPLMRTASKTTDCLGTPPTCFSSTLRLWQAVMKFVTAPTRVNLGL